MRFALFACATAWSVAWQSRDRVETVPSVLPSVRFEPRAAFRRAPSRVAPSPGDARWLGMAPVLIVALGLSGSSPVFPTVKAAFRATKKEAKQRRLPWEPVGYAKSITTRKRAKASRRGLRGHVVPEAAPDVICEAIASARTKLDAIAEERSFDAPEKTEREEGSSSALDLATAKRTRYDSYRRQRSYKFIDSAGMGEGLANMAENLYCDVEAGEQPALAAGLDSSPQAHLTAQCFNFWPILCRKLSYMSSEDRSMVWRALCVACASASTKRREDCRPLDQITTVALILADLELDVATVAAGLLHNVLEETELTAQDLTLFFSAEVSTIVTGCTKVSKLRGMPPHALTDEEQAENLREMLLAMADDSRVILLKCAVRLYEMRTLSENTPPHRERIALAQETLDIFVPLAGKSGIYAIKAELADLAFKHLQPVEYGTLIESVEKYTQQSDAELELALKWLDERIRGDELLNAHCATVRISGRVKNLYSIWQKTRTSETGQDIPLNVEDIEDIYAARMIIDYPQQPWESEEEYRDRGIALCYHVFGLLEIKLWTEILSKAEDVFAPTWTVNGKFKDYIAVPKPNGYQSLHTVVMRKLPVEVQVRTNWMHVNAEYGIASHWLYKDQKAGLDKIRSYKSAFLDPLKRFNSEIVDSRTFMDCVRKELLGKRTFVYLPDNRILNIPRGSTALDAAFKIHSDIGLCMRRAFVNSEPVHAATKLQNGDRIFIETDEEPQANETWLENAWIRSSRAKVRQYLRMQDQTNELREHLKEKELRDTSTSALTDAHGARAIPNEPIGKQTFSGKFTLLEETAQGEMRRTRAAVPAQGKEEEPEFALV